MIDSSVDSCTALGAWCCAMHLLRAEHEIGERQREQRLDLGDGPATGGIRARVARCRRGRRAGGRSFDRWHGRAIPVAMKARRRAPAQEFGAAQCRGGASRCQIRAQRRFTTTLRAHGAAFARRCAQAAAEPARPAAAWTALARRQLRRLLPQNCALCAAPVPDALVCTACAAALPTIHPACPRCALPSPGGAVCGACLAHPPPFTATLAAHAYAFPVDRLLQALKYGGQIALGEWAGETLAARVRREAPDPARAGEPPLLVPLPLAPARQRQRGFNQAQRDRAGARARARVAARRRARCERAQGRRRPRCRGRRASATSAAPSPRAGGSTASPSRSSTT